MRVMKTKRKQSELKQKESINDKSAVLQDALTEIVAESWRFERTLEKMLERMDKNLEHEVNAFLMGYRR